VSAVPVSNVCDLGVIIDEEITMTAHVNHAVPIHVLVSDVNEALSSKTKTETFHFQSETR